MKYQTIIISIVLFFVILFAGLNWALFTTPSSLNLLFKELDAPLGIIMLIVIAILSVVYLITVGAIETGALVQNKRSTKELEKARKLAENEEQSRYNELKKYLGEELNKVNSRLNEIQGQLESSGTVTPIKKEEKGFFKNFKKHRDP